MSDLLDQEFEKWYIGEPPEEEKTAREYAYQASTFGYLDSGVCPAGYSMLSGRTIFHMKNERSA
jgi:hypothetical protein